jgi:selenocysteine lyase/cysteine desulfurase
MSAEPLDVVPDLPALRAAYARFLEGDRVLLTGHSHQAWPDAARDALLRSFDDAARLVDDKWDEAIFPMLGGVGARILERMGFDAGDALAFGKSTHELVFRLLTCFPVAARPRIVTTTGEFHSLHRQLARLAEEGAEVAWVPAEPREGLADRLLQAITPGTAVVAFSAVLFEDAHVVPRLGEIAARAVEVGAVPLVDAYHAFNAVPLAWGPAKEQLFVTAGGYKYAEFGEGICWLRVPRDTAPRPAAPPSPTGPAARASRGPPSTPRRSIAPTPSSRTGIASASPCRGSGRSRSVRPGASSRSSTRTGARPTSSPRATTIAAAASSPSATPAPAPSSSASALALSSPTPGAISSASARRLT